MLRGSVINPVISPETKYEKAILYATPLVVQVYIKFVCMCGITGRLETDLLYFIIWIKSESLSQ